MTTQEIAAARAAYIAEAREQLAAAVKAGNEDEAMALRDLIRMEGGEA